ncbi:glycosyltransferase family 2 protein [Pedobacter agri]|uniref:glycosyltransferase family 2 protein n=1 Tax=Pedobacter agri TaxID=454586 RepID=UPI00292DAD04|nr:glycosyltransferase family 2 protein [Pedobacter agri]
MEVNHPLVSIIIPTYNYAHLIEETLQSVLNQTYKNWECIIIDDESVDNTAEVVGDFISAHGNYRFVYKRITNGGTSVAKNTGIALAKGKYLQFLDADDLLSAEKINVQVNIASQQQADLIFSKSLFFMGDASEPQFVTKYPKNFLANESVARPDLFKRLIVNNVLTISSPLVSRQLVLAAGCFKPELKNNEDWLFWFNVAQHCQRFIYDANDRSYVLIRVHGSSAMTNHQNMFHGEVVVRNYIHEVLSLNKQGMDVKNLLRLNADLLALHQVRSLHAVTGLRHILSNFVKNPIKEAPLLKKAMIKLAVRACKYFK